MDVCDFLPVRFHFNGKFLRNSNGLFYVGGTQAMSYIDRDKLSLPEVVGHLRDHLKALVWFWLIDETLSANLVYQSDYEIGSTTPSDEAMTKIMTMVIAW